MVRRSRWVRGAPPGRGSMGAWRWQRPGYRRPPPSIKAGSARPRRRSAGPPLRRLPVVLLLDHAEFDGDGVTPREAGVAIPLARLVRLLDGAHHAVHG